MLIKFTPKQIAEQWNDLWPLIKDDLPLAHMRDADGVGVLGGLLADALHAFAIIDEGQPLSVKGASALMVVAIQGDPFVKVPILYVYSYHEVKEFSDNTARGAMEGLWETLDTLGASCLVFPSENGSLGRVMPPDQQLVWRIYDRKDV